MRIKKSGVPCNGEGSDDDFHSAPSMKGKASDAAPKSNKNSVFGGAWCRCSCLCGGDTKGECWNP